MTSDHYENSGQHILAELERLDLLVRMQVERARRVHKSDPQFQGLYVSEEEVDALLTNAKGFPSWATNATSPFTGEAQTGLDRLREAIEERKNESLRRGIPLRLERLASLFDLKAFDIDVLLIGLAPELDLRYERLFSYLQDDVTKKRPSVDLVLNLFCSTFEAKLAARNHFCQGAALLKHHLISLIEDQTHPHPTLLSKYIKVDERIVKYLLDGDEPDGRLMNIVQLELPEGLDHDLFLPDEVKTRLTALVREHAVTDRGLILYFHGPYGSGKRTTARALCAGRAWPLLSVDGERLPSEAVPFDDTVALIMREAVLQGAALYWTGFDALLAEDKSVQRRVFLAELDCRHGLTFLAGESVWEPAGVLHDIPFVRYEFPRLTCAERVELWIRQLGGASKDIDRSMLEVVASKFRFSGGQIRDAAATAKNLARTRSEANTVQLIDLVTACRLQSNRKLASIAVKVKPHYKWGDMVLPDDRLQQLREICHFVKFRALVHGEWGFDAKLALGKGVNVLFAGPSGTGKTMAADIIAGELGLDLYKIDLSNVVSKYIGETEKNLAKIFNEAETSNAILFFDEADALFGKRSEVRDSHDRYANIEVGYLLQKMEEYEGIVILATNFRRNMDDAFVRRLQVTIEFPFPNESDRRRIWQQIWPVETPRSSELDLDFMARRFEIAGGNIRNIALTAAFLAADNGQVVTMRHLLSATRREYQKMGKVVSEGEFSKP